MLFFGQLITLHIVMDGYKNVDANLQTELENGINFSFQLFGYVYWDVLIDDPVLETRCYILTDSFAIYFTLAICAFYVPKSRSPLTGGLKNRMLVSYILTSMNRGT